MPRVSLISDSDSQHSDVRTASSYKAWTIKIKGLRSYIWNSADPTGPQFSPTASSHSPNHWVWHPSFLSSPPPHNERRVHSTLCLPEHPHIAGMLCRSIWPLSSSRSKGWGEGGCEGVATPTPITIIACRSIWKDAKTVLGQRKPVVTQLLLKM